jgi:hypothetical protein
LDIYCSRDCMIFWAASLRRIVLPHTPAPAEKELTTAIRQ